MTAKNFLPALAAICLLPIYATAQKDPKVDKVKMDPNKTIWENALNSPVHKTLVAGIKAGGLQENLDSPFLYTVFAPTDAAFAKLPPGTLDALTLPENKPQLVKVLSYHVLQGKITTADIERLIQEGHGTATLKTLEGEKLTFTGKKKKIEITDEKGGKAQITVPDIYESNGVTHVVDAVLMP